MRPADPKRNEELLLRWLKEIQAQSHLVTVQSLTLRLQFLELIHLDADVISRLQDPEKQAEVIDAYQASWDILSTHKQMFASDQALIKRFERLDDQGLVAL
jgi:hypothetical protein